jgi:hypothetical protein
MYRKITGFYNFQKLNSCVLNKSETLIFIVQIVRLISDFRLIGQFRLFVKVLI